MQFLAADDQQGDDRNQTAGRIPQWGGVEGKEAFGNDGEQTPDQHYKNNTNIINKVGIFEFIHSIHLL